MPLSEFICDKLRKNCNDRKYSEIRLDFIKFFLGDKNYARKDLFDSCQGCLLVANKYLRARRRTGRQLEPGNATTSLSPEITQQIGPTLSKRINIYMK